MKRNYARVLPYERDEFDGKLRRKDEISVAADSDGTCLERDNNTITTDEMARYISALVLTSLIVSLASGLVELCNQSWVNIFWDLCRS